ncbi:MAG TPA: hypothetical protein VKB37_07175 [Jatrophihabitantaceae bacterium]|nr:hypothetical protein [Jatrophihabitantaceae bacterium]
MFGDAVVLWGGHHPPLGDRVVVALFGAAWVGGDHGAAQCGAELGQGLLRCATQHPLFDLRGRLGIERANGCGEFHGVQVGELPTAQ